MTNEQILLGLLGLVITIMVGGLGSFVTLFFMRRKNGGHHETSGDKDPSFWQREFDRVLSAITLLTQAQQRCTEKQEEVLERLDRLITIMEGR